MNPCFRSSPEVSDFITPSPQLANSTASWQKKSKVHYCFFKKNTFSKHLLLILSRDLPSFLITDPLHLFFFGLTSRSLRRDVCGDKKPDIYNLNVSVTWHLWTSEGASGRPGRQEALLSKATPGDCASQRNATQSTQLSAQSTARLRTERFAPLRHAEL